MSAIEMNTQTVTTGDIHLHVATAGDSASPALVLLHGLYDRREVWDSIIPEFTTDYRVIAPDLRGHNRSSKPEQGYALADYAADLLVLFDSLEVSEAVLTGHSLGALIAAWFAAEHPDRVRSLVLVDPPFEQNEQSKQWLEYLLEAKRGTYDETYEMVKELNILTGDEAEWQRETEWLRATADGPFEALISLINTAETDQIQERLARISSPTLLLQADPLSGGTLSDTTAETVLQHLRRAEHHKFEQVGHSIQLEQPRELVQVMRQFLDRLS